jgi:3-isopropylmalate/(R)-2-methylmalate dehydratase small subunit
MSAHVREPVTTIASHYVVIPADNIDTDQIIPARFLKTTGSAGLGPHAFHDWRYASDGSSNPAFPLNAASAAGASILVTGRNFGCGSSREHAVWALLDAGIRAVISSAFADIFRGNALGNGLVPVQLPPELVAALMTGAAGTITIDVPAQSVVLPGNRTAHFDLPPFAKHCLVNGLDELGFLLEASDDIATYERSRRPAPQVTG